jgi:hypothetical protein
MFADKTGETSQIFKWNINSTKSLNVIPVKPTTKTSTTTKPVNKTTTTTNPQFGTATPIIININAPSKPSWFSRISFSFISFFQRIFLKK